MQRKTQQMEINSKLGTGGITTSNEDVQSFLNSISNAVSANKVNETIKQLMPNGYAALSEKGRQDLIKSNMNIDNRITMQPQFQVAAPTVNVDVKVDQFGRVTKNTSILNPLLNNQPIMNDWYLRTQSQYGKTSK